MIASGVLQSAGKMVSLGGLLLFAMTIPGFTCQQADAGYSNAAAGLSLRFRPIEGANVITSNEFRIVTGNPEIVLEGIVIWDNEGARPDAVVMHDCPEGDVTGAELEDCTIWQNVIYAVAGDGSVGLLPGETEPAAESLLLPDFGRALRYSSLFEEDAKASIPSDVFALAGCQE